MAKNVGSGVRLGRPRYPSQPLPQPEEAPRPLKLTPEFRARLESNLRLKLQPPASLSEVGAWDRRISGLPGDVLLTLEAIRLLGEQGNRTAMRLWEREVKRLGLWYDVKVWTRPA